MKEANELISKVFKTNSDDNIEARKLVKASGYGKKLIEFEKLFTYSDGD
jgi:hypothetical protein